MHFGQFLWVKYIVRHVIEVRKSGTPYFQCRSLLVNIIILNDIYGLCHVVLGSWSVLTVNLTPEWLKES